MKRIIYRKENGQLCVITAANNAEIKQVGTKDVPAGLDFWIVDALSIPPDRTMRDAWDIDLKKAGPCDGVGGSN